MNKKAKILIVVVTVIILLISVVSIVYYSLRLNNGIITQGRKDDWEYNGGASIIEKNGWLTGTTSVKTDATMGVTVNSKTESTLGYSVGGSKNIVNFRENIKNGYFPIFTDITYNGLFYDYYFDTGKAKESDELFSPSYSMAVSKDPISSEKEYYMTIGLNSNIKESDFKRKKQNIMVVLDISGSMSSSLNSYYYDNNSEETEEYKSKMELANEAVNLMLDELNEDDRFGMVLFDNSAYLAKPMNLIKETNIQEIKKHILEITAKGGTNFEAGYTKATESYTKEILNDDEYDNRIIVITDAMPNIGTTSKNGLLKYVQENADNKIYTSFIGVGVDFNTEIIEEISNSKGANYYSVSSGEQFKKILSEDFDYMLTPLVFDLNLDFESDSYEIEEVYGTDNNDKTSGNIIKVNTLFPSSTNSETGSKGGVILLKLKKKDNEINGNIKLNVSYTDRNEKKYSNSQQVKFEDDNEFYNNTGIRKAILLVRYVNSLKNWILYERSDKDEQFFINQKTGIIDCYYNEEMIYRILGENERTSVKLTVSEEYKEIFKTVKSYLENEKNEVKDEDLKQEIELLQSLINY